MSCCFKAPASVPRNMASQAVATNQAVRIRCSSVAEEQEARRLRPGWSCQRVVLGPSSVVLVFQR